MFKYKRVDGVCMVKGKPIRISRRSHQILESLKVHPRDTFDIVIQRLAHGRKKKRLKSIFNDVYTSPAGKKFQKELLG